MNIVNFFRRPDYRSEATEFIEQLKATRPQLEEGQRAGRALLWDIPVDWSVQREMEKGRVEQQPYVYQNHG
ncbi:MAG: DUF3460 family protein [Burkholderiaceae bacterium]|nr:DUF3460 family protein [Burkholderiaceae bacterium]